LGFKQREIAATMESSQPAVARLEAGQGDPRLSTLERYVAALGARLRLDLFPARSEESLDMSGEPERHELQEAMEQQVEDQMSLVASRPREESVYALGEPAGSEADILHFTIDTAGGESVVLPVFTGISHLRLALLKNPDWLSFKVLEINGGDLVN